MSACQSSSVFPAGWRSFGFVGRGRRASGRTHSLTVPVFDAVNTADGRKETAVSKSPSMCLICHKQGYQ